jgi:acyl-CoA thioesterase FadM
VDLIREFSIIGYPMVDTRAKLMAPSSFGDDIVIETRIAASRNSSFDVEHKAFKPSSEGEKLAMKLSRPRLCRPASRRPEAVEVATDSRDRHSQIV